MQVILTNFRRGVNTAAGRKCGLGEEEARSEGDGFPLPAIKGEERGREEVPAPWFGCTGGRNAFEDLWVVNLAMATTHGFSDQSDKD